MEAPFPVLSREVALAITHGMDTQGYGLAENCISEKALTGLRNIIMRGVTDAGGEYKVFTGAQAVQGTFLQELANCQNFMNICREIFTLGTHREAPATPFYQVLRCLVGTTGKQHAYRFHYDSYVLTILVPIIIPTEGQPGDLIMFPNTRPIRKTYLANLIDKICLDNTWTQNRMRKGVLSGRLTPERIRMKPGNVYFFWGCRSIHTNEPCDTDKIRATALFHYVNPHAGSWLRRNLLKLRNWRQLVIKTPTVKVPRPA